MQDRATGCCDRGSATTLQSGSKTCHSTKKFPRISSPNMSSQLQLENSPELIFYFNWEMSIGRFSGNSPWVLFWGVPQFSGGQISTKKFFELIFEICHLAFNLKLFWN